MAQAPNFRVDERKRFTSLKLIDGSAAPDGNYWLDLAAGHLQGAEIPFMILDSSDPGTVVIPLASILTMIAVPDGA